MADSQEQKLRDEILSDAQRKAERTLARARSDAEKLLQEGKVEQGRRQEARLTEARHTADERSRAILAGIEQAKRGERLQRQETVINEVFAAAQERLKNLPDAQRQTLLVALAAEAIPAIRSNRVCLQVAERDLALLRERQAELVQQTGVDSIEIQASADIEDGVVALSEDRARAYLNTLAQRVSRQASELRRIALQALQTGMGTA